MKTLVKSTVKQLPLIRRLVRQRDELHTRAQQLDQQLAELHTRFKTHTAQAAAEAGIVPPGHFYSPLLSLQDRGDYRNTNPVPRSYPGIDLNHAGQVALLNQFKGYYQEQPFKPHKQDGLRYYFDNDAYSYADALCLYCMIRHVRPGRIIEIGSGFSSCVTLDTNERFFDQRIACTFIEPNPGILHSLLKPEERQSIEILAQPLQSVDRTCFQQLRAGDILFIDSTHVYKPGSDVELIFSRILPSLPSGVYVHFHDMFYPFEYPQHWIAEGRAWNELYLVAAFLQFSAAFRIELWNHYLWHTHRDFLKAEMPLFLQNPGGSLWLRRT
jgi:hypothetical protein